MNRVLWGIAALIVLICSGCGLPNLVSGSKVESRTNTTNTTAPEKRDLKKESIEYGPPNAVLPPLIEYGAPGCRLPKEGR